MPDRKPKPDRITPHKDKLCKACRRPIRWTQQQARDWDIIKYCSDTCRGAQPVNANQALESAILELLAERGPNKTICPSEASKRVGGTETRQAWESLLEPARAAARRLVASGKILITQHNHPVDAATAKGPIRLRLR
jgi:hypothetical protein